MNAPLDPTCRTEESLTLQRLIAQIEIASSQNCRLILLYQSFKFLIPMWSTVRALNIAHVSFTSYIHID